MSTIFSIGINAYEANVAKRVGSNQYAFRLLVELELLTRERTDIQICAYLPEAPLFDLPKARSGFSYVLCPPKKLWTQWRLPLELYIGNRRHDVFLSLGHYAPRFCPYPTAVCILDLAYLKFPQFFLPKDLYQLREWTKYSVNKAKHIFTISKASKADIVSQYKRNESEVSIVYPGVEEMHSTESSTQSEEHILQKFQLTKNNYIVSVGTIQPRKNMIAAIHAFEKLAGNSKVSADCKLVFIGKAGWMTAEFDQAVATSPVKERIIVTGFIEESDKQILLSQAACSFMVGFYEGFGIPVVESLLVGVRPVVAQTSSLPEVAGEFGVMVDPYSIDSIMAGFQAALGKLPDPMERAQMHEWAKQFSWETGAKNMLAILEKEFKRAV